MSEVRYIAPPCLFDLDQDYCGRDAAVVLLCDDQRLFACDEHTAVLAAELDRGYGVDAVRLAAYVPA